MKATVASATKSQSKRLREGAASPADWRPSMRASTKSGERPYRSDSRSAAARHCALSFGEALENEMAPTPRIMSSEPPMTCA